MKKLIVRLLQIKKNKNRRDQHKNKQKIIKEIHTIFFPTRGSPFSAITTAHTSPFAAKNFKFPTFLVWASPEVRSQKTTIELVLLLWMKVNDKWWNIWEGVRNVWDGGCVCMRERERVTKRLVNRERIKYI